MSGRRDSPRQNHVNDDEVEEDEDFVASYPQGSFLHLLSGRMSTTQVALYLIQATTPGFNFWFILVFVGASFLQENHPYAFALAVIVYLILQGFSGKDSFDWSQWSFPYRTTAKAFLVVFLYILIGVIWATVRCVFNIIRLEKLASSELIEIYKKCHQAAKVAGVRVNQTSSAVVYCNPEDYLSMMAVQKGRFLQSALLWPLDFCRIAITELFSMLYDIGYAILKQYGADALRWGDGIRQRYMSPQDL